MVSFSESASSIRFMCANLLYFNSLMTLPSELLEHIMQLSPQVSSVKRVFGRNRGKVLAGGLAVLTGAAALALHTAVSNGGFLAKYLPGFSGGQ